jgi:hypothetical protein
MLGFSVDGLIEALGFGYYILIYGVGVLAMVLSVIAYQFRRRVAIIFSNFLGQACWTAYFLLQGDVTSAIVCFLCVVMLALFAKKEQWPWTTSIWSIAVFVALFTVISLLTFAVWSDVFPLLAGVFAVIANSRTTEKRLRQFSVLWCLFWLLNSIFKLYPVALCNDLFCTASTVVSLVRYRGTDGDERAKNQK